MTKGKIQGFEGSRVKVYKAEHEKLRNLNQALIPASQFLNFLASVFNIVASPVSWCRLSIFEIQNNNLPLGWHKNNKKIVIYGFVN